jgi:hypothetical protein
VHINLCLGFGCGTERDSKQVNGLTPRLVRRLTKISEAKWLTVQLQLRLLTDRRLPFPYRIMEGLPVTHPQPPKVTG